MDSLCASSRRCSAPSCLPVRTCPSMTSSTACPCPPRSGSPRGGWRKGSMRRTPRARAPGRCGPNGPVTFSATRHSRVRAMATSGCWPRLRPDCRARGCSCSRRCRVCAGRRDRCRSPASASARLSRHMARARSSLCRSGCCSRPPPPWAPYASCPNSRRSTRRCNGLPPDPWSRCCCALPRASGRTCTPGATARCRSFTCPMPKCRHSGLRLPRTYRCSSPGREARARGISHRTLRRPTSYAPRPRVCSRCSARGSRSHASSRAITTTTGSRILTRAALTAMSPSAAMMPARRWHGR